MCKDPTAREISRSPYATRQLTWSNHLKVHLRSYRNGDRFGHLDTDWLLPLWERDLTKRM